MSLRSATRTIQALNPRNTSGSIPQALDMIQSLKRVTGNPTMMASVGPQNLIAALQALAAQFANKKSKYQSKDAYQEEQREQTVANARLDQVKQQASETVDTVD